MEYRTIRHTSQRHNNSATETITISLRGPVHTQSGAIRVMGILKV